VWINVGLFALSCIVLIVAGSVLVKSLTRIATFLRMSEFLAAFVFMAISTSLPELFVGVQSARAGNPALALGTVIGSNIADLTFVAGISILIARGVVVKSQAVRKDVWYMLGLAALPMMLMFFGHELSRTDAIILLIALALYGFRLAKTHGRYEKEYKDHVGRWEIMLQMILFLTALGVLFISSDYVVLYATELAIEMAMPAIFVGLIFLAIGTSLPELVFEAKSMMSRKSEMALGDLIGSVIMNSTLVLAVTALIMPITANFFLFLTSAFFMLVVTFIFATFVYTGRKLTYIEGIAMLLLYIFFLVGELNIQQYFI